MTGAGRVFIGALLGALLVLVLHPSSRPYFGQGAWALGASTFLRETPYLPENLEALPEPHNLEVAGLWVLAGHQALISRRPLTQTQLERLLAVARQSAQAEPDNAFWNQSSAVFLDALGRTEEAHAAWETASYAARWRDYQSARLEGLLAGLARESGRDFAWHAAFALERRSSASARMIVQFGRRALATATADPARLLEMRTTTIRNAVLLRDGSRQIEASEMGARLIDFATFPYDPTTGSFINSGPSTTPRRALAARDALAADLGQTDPRERDRVIDAFFSNDAWLALVNPEVGRRGARDLTYASLLTATLPGALFMSALSGLAILGAGYALEAWPWLRVPFRMPWAPILGLLLGLCLFLLTGLALPSVWVVVAFGCLALVPDRPRRVRETDLGPAFALVQGVLAILLAVAMAALWVGLSTPGTYLLRELGTGEGVSVHVVSLGALVVVMLALLPASAAGWALVHDAAPEALVPVALRACGLRVALGCLVLAVLSTPVAIALDQQLASELTARLANEPNVYLAREAVIP